MIPGPKDETAADRPAVARSPFAGPAGRTAPAKSGPAKRVAPRRPVRSRPARSPILPVLIVVGVCALMAVAWGMLGRSSPVDAASPTDSLLAAAESGDETAFQALAAAPEFNGVAGKTQRSRLADAVHPLLTSATRAPLLKVAIAAAVHQGCDGLAPAMSDLALHVTDLPDRIGGPEPAADLIAHCLPGSPDTQGVVANLARMIAAGTGPRAVANATLQRMAGDAWMKVPGFVGCLSALVQVLPDPASLRSLQHLAANVCRRSDEAAKLGSDPAAWRAWVEADAGRSSRCAEIAAWLGEHGSADRVADGADKLEEHRRFLVLAKKDLDSWLEDASWQGPLGWPRDEIEGLMQKVSQAQYANRTAIGGAGIKR